MTSRNPWERTARTMSSRLVASLYVGMTTAALGGTVVAYLLALVGELGLLLDQEAARTHELTIRHAVGLFVESELGLTEGSDLGRLIDPNDFGCLIGGEHGKLSSLQLVEGGIVGFLGTVVEIVAVLVGTVVGVISVVQSLEGIDFVVEPKLVRGLEWMPDSRGRVRFRGLVLPAVLDAPLTCEGPILHDPEVGSIVPAPLQELCVVKALAEKGGAGLRLSLDGVPNQHANSDPRPQDKHFYFYHSLLFRLEE